MDYVSGQGDLVNLGQVSKCPLSPQQQHQQQQQQQQQIISPSSSTSSTSSGSSSVSSCSRYGAAAGATASNNGTYLVKTVPDNVSTSPSQVASKCGMPRVASLSMDTAPVHIDVGGCIYTSSLETLTKYADSRISKMFNGTIPIVLDTLKQHYFIDRDGKSFRHILNYMRTGRLVLPDQFDDYESLLSEARYYELDDMVKQLDDLIECKKRLGPATGAAGSSLSASVSTTTSPPAAKMTKTGSGSIVYDGQDLDYERLIDSASLSQMPKAKQTALILRSAFRKSTHSAERTAEQAPFSNDKPASNTSMDDEDNKAKELDDSSASLVEWNRNKSNFKLTTGSDKPASTSTQNNTRMLIVNCADAQLLVSGEKKLIHTLVPELDADSPSTDVETTESQAKVYVDKLPLTNYNISLIKLMERLYDNGFQLEACYGNHHHLQPSSPGSEGLTSDSSPSKSTYTEYIFISKCK